jgi:IS1 family transposase
MRTVCELIHVRRGDSIIADHIERTHLTLRTRIKRLVRKTICCSQTTQMHDIVIGWFVNRYALGRTV